MNSRIGYHLVDFGEGRKLESVAGRLIDRPSPAASGHPRRNRRLWSAAESYFCAQSKAWTHQTPWPDELTVDCGGFVMPVRPTPYGHIGLFPEQSPNWDWLQQPVWGTGATKSQDVVVDASGPVKAIAADPHLRARPRALNLFAYTGASTMALARSGYHVAHVDAAKPNVMAARRAAAINGLQAAPIRYLVDDAVKFAAREIRRGNRYHTIVLDPPAYGHGPTGKAWRIERDLWDLLSTCLDLLQPSPFRLLVTGHSEIVTEREIADFLVNSPQLRSDTVSPGLRIDSGRSQLKDQTGRALDTGFFVRVVCSPV